MTERHVATRQGPCLIFQVSGNRICGCSFRARDVNVQDCEWALTYSRFWARVLDRGNSQTLPSVTRGLTLNVRDHIQNLTVRT